MLLIESFEKEVVKIKDQVKEYIEKYPSEIIYMFEQLRKIVYECVSSEPNETMWAKLPSYYIGDAFVRLIPFKDHINIEAKAIIQHTEELTAYKLTPKGMLQIRSNQEIPYEALKKIFSETLE